MPSNAMSFSRSTGSHPPARRWWLVSKSFRFGKRSARSRKRAGSRVSQRSSGSAMCASAEMRCSVAEPPVLSIATRGTGTLRPRLLDAQGEDLAEPLLELGCVHVLARHVLAEDHV